MLPKILRAAGRCAGASVLTVALAGAPLAGAARAAAIERVSVDSSGAEGQASGIAPDSLHASISADGRYVAFDSAASNLTAADTNGVRDVFVHDRATGDTTRVSVNGAGAEANGRSDNPSISANGRVVAFVSLAGNLVPGDTNGTSDVFVHDRVTRSTERASVDSDGGQADDGSFYPSVSADGRYVAFFSGATNLVPADTNGAWDVFVHDRVTGITERASVDGAGAQAAAGGSYPSISADGRYVAFESASADLVGGDTNDSADIFVHDRTTGTTERVSVGSAGAQADAGSFSAAVSGDGRHVAFGSAAANLVDGDTNGSTDIFVHDRTAGTTERVSVAGGGAEAHGSSFSPSTSATGRYVAFESQAADLVAGDANGATDVFVHDRVTGSTERVSAAGAGLQESGGGDPSLSAGGRYSAFASTATTLVAGDTNQASDVFVTAAAPACAGDCNDDGVISINEVVNAVNIFLQNSPASGCANADANGDGDVLINEVVAAVSSFLDPFACPLVPPAVP